MAVNRYFNNFPSEERITNEYLLMEDVIVESIQIMGHNVYYIPRESFDEGDMVFGEYSKSAFNKAYIIEAYLSNVTGHEGQGDFFSKFGLEIRDTDTFVLSRRSFLNVVPGSIRMRPQEGDLVYVPVLHKMYEIKFVEQELMFHSIGKRLPFVYEMRCEAFRGAQEPINTGIQEIDQVGIDNNYSISLNLVSTGGPTDLDYFVGEEVFQSPNNNWNGAYAHATVKQWFASNTTLWLYNIVGDFQSNSIIIGNTSQAIYNVASINDYDQATYNLTDNEEVYNDAGIILDLSETNPFGSI
jgi:hypothetical protein